MQVSVETTGSIGRRITVSIPAEELETAVAEQLKRLSRNVRMPGFRKGKVPMKVVEAQYGRDALAEASNQLVQNSIQEALSQESLVPAGLPGIELKTIERGKEFEYVAEFDVYPAIPKPDLSGEEVEKIVAEVTDADVDHTINTMLEQRKSWNPVDRAAADGDQVVIDFVGRIDGEAFAGGSAEAVPLVLGSGSMIEGFEAGIKGAKPDETVNVDVTFPADYRAENLAGKKAQFEITVKTVSEPELPPLDDEFAKELGIDGGVEQMKSDVRDNLERERKQRERNLLRNKVLETLLKVNEFDVPKGLISQEIRHMRESDRQQRMAQGLAGDNSMITDDIYEKLAERRVALGLIMAEIVKEKDLKADADQVRQRVEDLAANYESPQAVVAWHYEKPGRLASLEQAVLEDLVVDAVLMTAKVKESKIGFQELVKSTSRA
ncbi:MAG: trigger factor [Gammaproteobacteria bacterium]|nr:trigger factor [Gammaproteobacteria bacterium]